MSVRRIDFNGRDWSAHAQDHWLDFAGNPNLPDYLRVVFVAYGRHAANGHAKLERGELAYFLVRKDGTLPERRVLWRALSRAIELGYLRGESKLLCLVVSSLHVQGGQGNADAPCPRDHTTKTTARRTNVGRDGGRFASNVGNDARRSETNVGSECRRSVLSPSLSSTTPATPPLEAAS